MKTIYLTLPYVILYILYLSIQIELGDTSKVIYIEEVTSSPPWVLIITIKAYIDSHAFQTKTMCKFCMEYNIINCHNLHKHD